MTYSPAQLRRIVRIIVIFISVVVTALFYSRQDKQAENDVAQDSPNIQKTDANPHYDVSLAQDKLGQNKHASVDYYMLVLSWSPGFCAEQREHYGNHLPAGLQYQCDSQQQFGWVVHGLWPQNANARSIHQHPRFCQGDLPPVDRTLLVRYLSMSPGLQLLQGEWEKHGACAFNQAQAYFDQAQRLFNSLTLPSEKLSKGELFRFMRKNNPQLAGKYMNASHNELKICYDLAWQPMDCPMK
ncbi:ribonuclease T2 family protein [Spirabiliibacterium falconis]|uniref:ribonuclease T2 family protein n=1 Tax=Spirabiliibacterium falconis TaxID=572023 RepID=UPI001AAE02F3|nr:ribonuclease [Spirabiliibacterium falconis]MBE2893539.1 ribonuclease [Spirabiliibacterium falconis]